MATIDCQTERRIEEVMRKTSCIQVEGCRIYLASYQGEQFLRYVEGDRHITFDSKTEKANDSPYLKFLSNTLTGLYPRTYVLEVEARLTWDNEAEPLSDEDREAMLDRVRRAVSQKYSAFRIDSVK